MKPTSSSRQLGASLLEVLVAILILSFGMLALSGMLAFSVQMPKMAAYRATATALAASHIERMRANPQGFRTGAYTENSTYNDGTVLAAPNSVSPPLCAYPTCTPDTVALRDRHETKYALQKQLTPTAGMRVRCSGDPVPVCTDLDGDLWIIWQEPTTFASLDATNSDECPAGTVFAAPKPRCLHVRFKL